jgi:hypothetical protein
VDLKVQACGNGVHGIFRAGINSSGRSVFTSLF